MTDWSVSGRTMAKSRTVSPKAKARLNKPSAATGNPKSQSGPDTRKVRSLERRDAILAAALEEFSARGFEATRLDDVAARAKIAKGTIYLYFRDKETLFQELIRAMLTDRLVDVFVREVYETGRKDVVRLMITEGRRFPKIAEFYYREVLSHIMAAVRGIIRRAAARGEVPEALIEFPQILVAPWLIAIIWSGLFERFEPLDVRAMMKTHVALILAAREAA